MSAARAFLRNTTPSLTIKVSAHVLRLIMSGNKVTGVSVRLPTALEDYYADSVILCAGAVGSPQVLELSGIGRPGVLEPLGLRVQHALPGVGENLQDHLQLRAVWKVRGVPTVNELASSWAGRLRMGLEYVLFRSGPLSMAPSQMGAFTRSSERHSRPNIEFHVQPLSLNAFGQPLHPFPAITASVCNLRPTSRGSVHIASLDPADSPKIAPRYLSTAEDRLVAAESLRVARRVMAAPALAPFVVSEMRPGLAAQTDEELARAAGDIGTTIFHPVGTCAMGTTPETGAVVDDQLRVHGLRGLLVADASVMPRITSGNTNAPTIMIAEKAAEMLLK
jgi:choline dehydrogenase